MRRKIKQKWYIVIIVVGVVFLVTFAVFIPIIHFGILDRGITMDLHTGFNIGFIMGGIQAIDWKKQGKSSK